MMNVKTYAEHPQIPMPRLPDPILAIPVQFDPDMLYQAAYFRNREERRHVRIVMGRIPASCVREVFLHEVAHALQHHEKIDHPGWGLEVLEAWVADHTDPDFVDAYRYIGARRFFVQSEQNAIVLRPDLIPWFPEPPPWVQR